tara:strand:+ start:591 stop:785 length:195 start_codon:yes stop_codon:yes gene_type:complete
MKTNSMPALEWVQTIPSNRWVKVKGTATGILDLVGEFNARHNGSVRVRVTPAPEVGWVKVKRMT